MRHFVLAVLVSMCVFLSGCALLDSLMLSRMRNEQGQELYVDREGKLTREAADAQGNAHEPAYSSEPSEAVGALAQGAQALGGPWGAAAGAGLGLIAAAYAAMRGRRQVNAARAKTEAWQGGMALLVNVLEDIKTGAIDADRNGKISLKEIREYVRKRGKEALKPAFVAEVVRIVTSTLTPTEKQRALEEAAAKLA
ncbi:hypothetical protein PLCT2_01845 [Planctomycetaceae bacterium]|nr:hypothetical protein PLCT2_01845 [Planctomycetaceae bacterium]